MKNKAEVDEVASRALQVLLQGIAQPVVISTALSNVSEKSQPNITWILGQDAFDGWYSLQPMGLWAY